MSGQGGETERLLSAIIDQLPAMVGYWDADRMLRYANAGYRAWFSPQRDPLGRSRAELLGSACDATGEQDFAAALAGQERQFERRLANAAGQTRRVEGIYRPDRHGSVVAGVFVLLTDLDLPRAAAAQPAPIAEHADGPAAARPADPPPVASPPPAFSGIPGLTMAKALVFLPGRDQIYSRVLRQFAGHYGAGVPGLAPALQSGRLDEARRLLHSLRGACGAIGATVLAAKALDLEQTLATPQADPAGRAGVLAQELDDLTQAIDRRLRELEDQAPGEHAAEAGPPPAAEARQQLLSGLAALEAQLRVADFRAGASFRALAPALRAALGEQALRRLERPLLAYDHDAALQALTWLRARLPDGLPPPAQ